MTDKERRRSGRLYSQPHSFDMDDFAKMQQGSGLCEPASIVDSATLALALKHVGEGTMMVKPFRCNFPGEVSVGDHSFINENCYMMSEGGVDIGSGVDIAPNVCIYTVTHPLRWQDRREGTYMHAKKVTVKDHAWICANVVLNPGVTIGEDSVIAPGSVVTRDIPDGVFAGGVPCRVIRPITEADGEAFAAELAEYRADPDTRGDQPWTLPGMEETK